MSTAQHPACAEEGAQPPATTGAGLTPAQWAALADAERDPWLPDHRPYPALPHPLFSAVMMAEIFSEAACALYPYLVPVSLAAMRFLDMLPCQPGTV